jgi:hypothetical protein
LLLRFHPERRRTGAATFVGRGTAAAVVIIIMRRRNKKRRSVKRSKEGETKNGRRPLALSQINKQTNKWTYRPLESLRRHHEREVLGKRTHFVSQSHLREEEKEEGK